MPTDGDDWIKKAMIKFASLTIYDVLKDKIEDKRIEIEIEIE